MAKKTKITKWAVLLFVVLLGSSCAKTHNESSILAMINMAKTLGEQLSRQNIYRVQSRCDYYICDYNNASSYIVSHDCMVIRDINNNMEIISANAKKDIQLPDSLQNLLVIVRNLHLHNISYVSVKVDTIKIVTFDGYFITNTAPPNNNALKVQDSWHVILNR